MLKNGSDSSYRSLHMWVERKLGKPSMCEHCDDSSKVRYEWANKSGNYRKDLSDWIRLCKSCHLVYDYGGLCKRKLHDLNDQGNIYIDPDGVRSCRICKVVAEKQWKDSHIEAVKRHRHKWNLKRRELRKLAHENS